MISFRNNDYEEEAFLEAYMNQKKAENDAKEIRVEMEKSLLERYGDMVDDDKLTKQFKVGRYTVKIKRNITYKLTEHGWDMVWKMPEAERPIKYEYSHSIGKNTPWLMMEEVANETKPSFEVTYK